MDKGRESAAASVKRPYEAPALIRRDSLAEVTAVLKKNSGDKPKEVPCWVARAVYGEDNPRWLAFRAWLFEDAPAWLRAVYLRYGSRFAPVVQRRPWLADALRPLMDRAIAGRLGKPGATRSGAKASSSR